MRHSVQTAILDWRDAAARGDVAVWSGIWLVLCATSVAVASSSLPSEVGMIGSLMSLLVLTKLRSERTPAWWPLAASLTVPICLLPLGATLVVWSATLAATWFLGLQHPGETSHVWTAVPSEDETIEADLAEQGGAVQPEVTGEPASVPLVTERSETEDGVLVRSVVVGTSPQRLQIHLPFVPSLRDTPEIEIEEEAGALEVTVSEATPFGVRLQVRGHGRATVHAFCGSNQTAENDQAIEHAAA